MKNISSRLPSGKQATASKKQVVYRVKNWAAYNQALVQRGTLTVWLSQEAVDGWRYGGPPQRGAQFYYSDLAIETALTLRLVYHLPLRQTEGFVESIQQLMDRDVSAQDHSTLSRRHGGLDIALPQRSVDEPIHMVVDSSGLKVYGEGEWKVRQHGWSSRRTWRKLRLGLNEATGEILAQTLTPNI